MGTTVAGVIGQDEWRAALASLASGGGDAALRHRAAVDLAQRLVAMAADGEVGALAVLLRPDPKVRATSWRVRQFRLGDIAPTQVVDHTDAAAAVLALAHPPREALVAGELVALAPDESGWVVLSRNDTEIVVQAPRPDTLLGPGGSDDGYGPLLGRWRRALEIGPAPEPPGVAVAPEPAAAEPAGAAGPEPAPKSRRAPKPGPLPGREAPGREAPGRKGPAAVPAATLPDGLVERLESAVAALEAAAGAATGPPPAAPTGDTGVLEALEALEARLATALGHIAGPEGRLAKLVTSAASEITAVGDRIERIEGSLATLEQLGAAVEALGAQVDAGRRQVTDLDQHLVDLVRDLASSTDLQSILTTSSVSALGEKVDDVRSELGALAAAVGRPATAPGGSTVAAGPAERLATADQLDTLLARGTALSDAISARFASLHHELNDRPAPATKEQVAELRDLLKAVVTEQLGALHAVAEAAAGRPAAVDAGEQEGLLTELRTLTGRVAALEKDLSRVVKRVVTTDGLATATDGLRTSLTTFVTTQVAELRASLPSRADHQQLVTTLRSITDALADREPRLARGK